MESTRSVGSTKQVFAGIVACLILAGCSATSPPAAEAPSGAAVFGEHCATCHALPLMTYMIPQMKGRPPGFVYDAVTEGPMRRIGAGLDDASRRAAAEFFTGVSFGSPAAARDFEISPRCGPEHAVFDWSDRAHPSWGGSVRNHHAVADGEGFGRDDLERLRVQWVVAFPEATQLRSHPTAAGGALFVGSHNGSVYALDQATGCTRWHFKAATEVRTAITLDFDRRPDAEVAVRAVFADRAANAYALDAETGALLWKQSVDPHLSAAITGSVTAHGGRVFVPVSSNEDVGPMDPRFGCCTHAGAVVALDVRTGEILWRTPTIAEPAQQTGTTPAGAPILGPSGASVWNTPTVSEAHGLLFVGSGNNHSHPPSAMSDSVLAMDLETGRIAWSYQAQAGDAWNAACLDRIANQVSCPQPEGPDTDFGATTMLLDVGGAPVLVAGQKSGELHALDPGTGEPRWRIRVSRGGPEAGIRYAMATRDGVVYAPSTDTGDHELRGMSARPGIFAFTAADGAALWETPAAELCAGRDDCIGAVGSAPLAMEEVLLVGSMDGILYGLDRASGDVLWQFETAREFTTLRGTTTRGGAILGTVGPTYANGRLFVSSGYGQASLPGNALIALAPE